MDIPANPKRPAAESPATPRTGTGRAQRADARSNRDRILTVAEQVFGAGGESASTEEVARLAGVGIATVFRHFPTKAALLEAVLVARFDRLRGQAEALWTAPEPGTAFRDFFGLLVDDSASKIAIAEALVAAGGDDEGAVSRASEELRRAVGVLLERARLAGTVRDDAQLDEVYALLVGVSRATVLARLDEQVRSRMLTIVFDGLAPRTGPPHRPAPPA